MELSEEGKKKRALKRCNKADAIFGGGGGGSCNTLGKHRFCPGLIILQRNEDKLLDSQTKIEDKIFKICFLLNYF